MGQVQKQSFRSAVISFAGLGLGYINRSILFPWVLLPNQIGLIGLILSLSSLFAQLGNMGVTHTIVRFFPFVQTDRKRDFFRFNLLIVLSGLCFFLLAFFFFRNEIHAYYSEKSALFNKYSIWVTLIGAANLFFIFFEHFLKSILQVVLPLLVQEFYLRLAVTVTIVLYATDLLTFDQFLTLHLSVHLLPFLVLLFRTIKDPSIIGVKRSNTVPARLKKLMVKYSTLSYLNSVAGTLVFSLDTIMLASMKGLAETGIYTTVLFVSSALQVPYRSIHRIASALVPKYWKKRDMEEMNNLYKRVSSMNLIFIVYLLLVVGWNIDEFFYFLPKEYAFGKWVFFVLMIGRASDAFSGINGYILVTSKKYYIDFYFTLTFIVSAFVLNYFMIPKWGSMGAAWATSIVISLYNAFRVFYLWRVYKLNLFVKSNLLVVLFAGLLSLPLIFIPFDFAHPIITVGIKFTYLTGLFFWLVIRFDVEPQLTRAIRSGLEKYLKVKI